MPIYHLTYRAIEFGTVKIRDGKICRGRLLSRKKAEPRGPNVFPLIHVHTYTQRGEFLGIIAWDSSAVVEGHALLVHKLFNWSTSFHLTTQVALCMQTAYIRAEHIKCSIFA